MPQSPLELGRNPDQGLQINKVFRIVRGSYLTDLQPFFNQETKPCRLISKEVLSIKKYDRISIEYIRWSVVFVLFFCFVN